MLCCIAFRRILAKMRESHQERRRDVANVFIGLQRSATDRIIVSKCRDLKEKGFIHSYDRDDVSGKYMIRYFLIEYVIGL